MFLRVILLGPKGLLKLHTLALLKPLRVVERLLLLIELLLQLRCLELLSARDLIQVVLEPVQIPVEIFCTDVEVEVHRLTEVALEDIDLKKRDTASSRDLLIAVVDVVVELAR